MAKTGISQLKGMVWLAELVQSTQGSVVTGLEETMSVVLLEWLAEASEAKARTARAATRNKEATFIFRFGGKRKQRSVANASDQKNGRGGARERN